MRLTLIVFFMLAMPLDSRAEAPIVNGSVLDLERCIGIALKNNPSSLAAKGASLAARHRVNQAQSNYYPQLSLSSGYRRLSSSVSPSGDSIDQYSGNISLNQNIYDFGMTSTRASIASLDADSARYVFESVSSEIVFNVKKAYYGVLQAKRNREVALQTVTQFEHRLEQARGFFDAGAKPKFDVTKAEVDLSNARLGLIRAENSVRLAYAGLNSAMGINDAPEYELTDNLSFVKYPILLEEALESAYKKRPDLQSQIAKRMSAEASVGLAMKGHYPALTASAGYGWSGAEFPLERDWNAGAALSVPIFSGYLIKYQTEEARANLGSAQASEEILRQGIALEVRQAYLNLREAAERIPVAELAVKQAAENLELANGRYEVGVGNPIEVTDAQVTYSNALAAYNQALYDYKVAVASIEKAMGAER